MKYPLRIHLVFVGKTGFGDIESAISRYTERLGRYCTTQIHYVKAEKLSAGLSENIVKSREGERIAKLVKGGHFAVLDQGGREMDSTGLAGFITKIMDSGNSDFWLALGGPVGISPDLVKRADSVISLSRMTLAHDLARLVLVEQLYRAFTILGGEPYHK